MKFLTSLSLLITAALLNLSHQQVFLNAQYATQLVASDGTLRVFYQETDTSIHIFQPFGLPPGGGFESIEILPSGAARANTPLAAANILVGSTPSIALYFFNNAFSGSELCEAIGANDNSNWAQTSFSSMEDTSVPDATFLYAFSWPAGGPAGRRVGFSFTDGPLGEFICTDTACWEGELFE